jgi:hypothetical protein
MPNQTVNMSDTASLSTESMVSPVWMTDGPEFADTFGQDREPTVTDTFYLHGSGQQFEVVIQGQELVCDPPFTSEYLDSSTYTEYLTSVTADEEELN